MKRKMKRRKSIVPVFEEKELMVGVGEGSDGWQRRGEAQQIFFLIRRLGRLY